MKDKKLTCLIGKLDCDSSFAAGSPRFYLMQTTAIATRKISLQRQSLIYLFC